MKREETLMRMAARVVEMGSINDAMMPRGSTTKPIMGMIRRLEIIVIVEILLK